MHFCLKENCVDSAICAANVFIVLGSSPLIMFWMCEHTVRTDANSFLAPNHFSTFNVRAETIWMSKAKCLKLRFNTPRGPLIVTIRDLTEAVMPRGIFTH